MAKIEQVKNLLKKFIACINFILNIIGIMVAN